MVIREDSASVSPQLIGAGLLSLAVVGPSLVAARRSRTQTMQPYRLILRFSLSALGYVGVIIAGALSREGPPVRP